MTTNPGNFFEDYVGSSAATRDKFEFYNRKQRNTNPFLEPYEASDEDEYTQVLQVDDSSEDNWFYLDPNGAEQGPFISEAMFYWYSTGYFDENLKVRRSTEINLESIRGLISKVSNQIFAAFSTTPDLLPSESLNHIAMSVINPFCPKTKSTSHSETKSTSALPQTSLLNSTTSSERCSQSPIEDEKPWHSKRHVIDICSQLERIRIKENKDVTKDQQKPTESLIKFKISTPANRKSPFAELKPKTTSTRNVYENTKMPKSANCKSNEIQNRLQKYWLDVANTKLSKSARCKSIEIRLNNVIVRGLIDSNARVSCLGAGSLEFITYQNIKLHEHNTSRTITDENGKKEKIVGHIVVNIIYKNLTVYEFKLIVVPSLTCFLYLGTDFDRAFKVTEKPQSMPACLKDSSHPVHLNNDLEYNELDPLQSIRLEEVKRNFRYFKDSGLGLTKSVTHSIDIDKNKPMLNATVTKPCLNVDSNVQTEIDEMLAQDLIEESCNRICFGELIAISDQGAVHLNWDYRKMNNATTVDPYIIPSRQEALQKIKTSNFISSLDIQLILWQISIETESRILTTFRVAGRYYQFKRTPPGLKNCPQTIYRLLDKILPRQLREHFAIAEKKLLIFSENFVDHVQHLQYVAQCFNEQGITIGATNSFCLSAINCFGYIVGSGASKRTVDACKCLTSISKPSTSKEIVILSQCIKWYRRFLNGCDKHIATLSLAEHSKTVPIDAIEAFREIKRQLTTEPVLAEPNFKLPFWLQCDANFKMISGLLYQCAENGLCHPVGYFFKELPTSQRSYSVTELECLAIVASLKHFDCYLEGLRFYLVTETNAIDWLMTHCPTNANERLSRWILKIQSYNFETVKREEVIAEGFDIFSRLTLTQRKKIENTLKKFGRKFSSYMNLATDIMCSPGNFPDYKIEKDLIYCRRHFNFGQCSWKLFIPDELKENVMKTAHVTMFGYHRKRKGMKDVLKMDFYWPTMVEDARKFVSHCEECSIVPTEIF